MRWNVETRVGAHLNKEKDVEKHGDVGLRIDDLEERMILIERTGYKRGWR